MLDRMIKLAIDVSINTIYSAQMTLVDVIQKREPKDMVGYNKMTGF